MALSAIGASLSPIVSNGGQRLSMEQQAEVQKLKQIDQKVRQHEAAHMAAGAGLISGVSFEYVRGPDGRQYAVAGEVQIDVSPGATPEVTLRKAEQVRAAALAPADPSPQDQAVAAAASLMAAQARTEQAAQKQREAEGGENGSSTGVVSSSTEQPEDAMSEVPLAARRSAQADTRVVAQAVRAYTAATTIAAPTLNVDVFA